MFGLITLLGILAVGNVKGKIQDAERETWARSNHLPGYHDHDGNYIKFDDNKNN